MQSKQSSLYSSSASNLNPIGTLYEMSKNYKSIRQLEEDDKKSILISRSSTQLSNCVDETPIKLDAEKIKPTLRSATSVINNHVLLNLPRPVSNLSSKSSTNKSSSISSASSTTSSRARSRTPTSTCSSLLNEQQSYRQATVSSSKKSLTGSSTENLSSNNKANLSTTSSTQYLPINTQSFQKKRTIF